MKTNVKNIVLFMAHIVSTSFLIIYGIKGLGQLEQTKENAWIVALCTLGISMYIIIPYLFDLKVKLFKGFGFGIEFPHRKIIITIGFIKIYGDETF